MKEFGKYLLVTSFWATILLMVLYVAGCNSGYKESSEKVEYPLFPENIGVLEIYKKINYKFVDPDTKQEYVAGTRGHLIYRDSTRWFPIRKEIRTDRKYGDKYYEAYICTYDTSRFAEYTPHQSIPVYRIRYALNGKIFTRYTVERHAKDFIDIDGFSFRLDTQTEQTVLKAQITEESKKVVEETKKEIEEYNQKVESWFNLLPLKLQNK